MKRSKMLRNLEYLLDNYHPIELSEHKNMALIILDHLEVCGMIPPADGIMKQVNILDRWSQDTGEKHWMRTIEYDWEPESCCIDCGVETTPGPGSARCTQCWDDRCGE